MAQQTRLGMYGGPRAPYGSFAGKAQAVINYGMTHYAVSSVASAGGKPTSKPALR